MDKQKVIKILRYNPYITVRDPWNAFVAARALNVEWQSEWLNFKSNLPDNKLDIKKESTYEECIDFDLSVNDDGAITLTITLWDGELLDGNRTNRRCKFSCILEEIPGFLHESLERQLQHIGKALYYKQEQIKKELEIKRLIDSFIKNYETTKST